MAGLLAFVMPGAALRAVCRAHRGCGVCCAVGLVCVCAQHEAVVSLGSLKPADGSAKVPHGTQGTRGGVMRCTAAARRRRRCAFVRQYSSPLGLEYLEPAARAGGRARRRHGDGRGGRARHVQEPRARHRRRMDSRRNPPSPAPRAAPPLVHITGTIAGTHAPSHACMNEHARTHCTHVQAHTHTPCRQVCNEQAPATSVLADSAPSRRPPGRADATCGLRQQRGLRCRPHCSEWPCGDWRCCAQDKDKGKTAGKVGQPSKEDVLRAKQRGKVTRPLHWCRICTGTGLAPADSNLHAARGA